MSGNEAGAGTKFKVGDRVRWVGPGLDPDLDGVTEGTVVAVDLDGDHDVVFDDFDRGHDGLTKDGSCDHWFCSETDLEHVSGGAVQQSAPIRVFRTGASRDGDAGKLDYEGFLSPTVLKRYAEYMHANRAMADGSVRDSDNWQKGMPRAQYMKSLARHHMDAWAAHRADELDRTDAEHALCGVIFNAMGLLHEVLLGRDVGAEDVDQTPLTDQMVRDQQEDGSPHEWVEGEPRGGAQAGWTGKLWADRETAATSFDRNPSPMWAREFNATTLRTAPHKFKVGDRVRGRLSGGFAIVIATRTATRGVRVLYDDMARPYDNTWQSADNYEPAPPAEFEVGDKVVGRLTGREGEIVREGARGTWWVRWCGDRHPTAWEHYFRHPTAWEHYFRRTNLKLGDRVRRGGLEGTVRDIGETGAHVLWDGHPANPNVRWPEPELERVA